MTGCITIRVSLPGLIRDLAHIDDDTEFETYCIDGVLTISAHTDVEEKMKDTYVKTSGTYDARFLTV